MELYHIEESKLNECLTLLITNRLIFQSKREYSDGLKFPSLLRNNPVSKLPYQNKLEAFLRFQKENPVEYAGYKSLYGFLEAYADTSRFFAQHFAGRHFLDGKQAAILITKSLFFSRSSTGNNKLDSIVELFYDFESESLKSIDMDFDPVMLILMLYGIIPASRRKQASSDPVFINEWNTLKDFCTLALTWVGDNADNIMMRSFEQRIEVGDARLNRVFFVEVASQITEYIKNVSSPQKMLEHLKSYDLDGLWRDNIGEQVSGDNIYYRFEQKISSYNLSVIEDYPTEQKYFVLATVFYDYDDETPVMLIQHPKAGYYHVIKGELGENYITWYSCNVDREDRPCNIWLKYMHGDRSFEMQMHHLVRMDESAQLKLEKEWTKKRKIDKYSRYACYYPITQGIVAVTKDSIYVKNPGEGLPFYRIPKSIDKRLIQITPEDEGGIIFVGEEKTQWVSFEAIALRIPPSDFTKLGIEQVNSIT